MRGERPFAMLSTDMSDITVRTLKCGATMIVERMSSVRSAAISCAFPGGSAHDPEDAQGRATMWAELLLRGAGGLSSREQADAFDRLGVSRSADLGAYTMRVAAGLLGTRVLATLPLLIDMILRPSMEDDAIGPCRDLALQAIASLNDDPQERASHLVRERHYQTPLNRSGLGTIEGLNGLTAQRLREDWGSVVKPVGKGSVGNVGGAIFAVAGAVELEPVIALVNRLTEGWAGEVAEPKSVGFPPRGYAHADDPSNQVQILLLHDAPPEPHPDSILEKVIANVLSGGMAGRLFTEVREKRGLCYSVSAGYRGEREFGSVSAYVGTTPDKAQESLDVLHEQLVRLGTAAGAVTAEEFQRAIVSMKSSVVFSGESTGARAASLASDYRRLGKARSLEEITAEVEALTLDRVNEYLSRRSMGRVTIQTLGPKALKAP